MVLDVDVIGALNVKRIYGDAVRTLFIAPPSLQTPPRRFTISDPIASSSGLYLLMVRAMGVSRRWAARRCVHQT